MPSHAIDACRATRCWTARAAQWLSVRQAMVRAGTRGGGLCRPFALPANHAAPGCTCIVFAGVDLRVALADDIVGCGAPTDASLVLPDSPSLMTPEDAMDGTGSGKMSTGGTSVLADGSSPPAFGLGGDAGAGDTDSDDDNADPAPSGSFSGGAAVVDLLPQDRPASLPRSPGASCEGDEEVPPVQLTLPLLDGAQSTPALFNRSAPSSHAHPRPLEPVRLASLTPCPVAIGARSAASSARRRPRRACFERPRRELRRGQGKRRTGAASRGGC